MQGTEPPTFRPTVWPAEPPGVPQVTRYQLEAIGDAAAAIVDVARDREPVDLPPDFVIREVAEVGDDDASVLAFIREWGLLTDLRDQAASVPGSIREVTLSVHSALAEAHPDRPADFVVSLELARMRLRMLRTLVQHVTAYRDGDETALLDAWSANGWERPRHTSEAWRWWQGWINAALYPFRMHVLLNPGDTSNVALTMPPSSLFNAAALQVTKYLGGDGPIARCANDRCRRPFTVQRGARRRYENTAHTTGVRYCSALCAKAQSERDRRARRRRRTTGRTKR